MRINRHRQVAAALLITLSIATARAETETSSTLVEVLHRGDDSLGIQLAFHLRETIRKSAGLSLADPGQSSAIQIHVATFDADATSTSRQSATTYSVVWTLLDPRGTTPRIFVDHTVGVCGSARLERCPVSVVARTDSMAQTLRQAVRLLETPSETGDTKK